MFRRFFRRDERDEKVEQGVKKSRSSFFGRVAVLLHRTEVTDELWDELEELLIAGDVGVSTTADLLDRLRARYRRGEFRTGEELSIGLQEELIGLLEAKQPRERFLADSLTVVLLIGVNGAGKTTSIAKLGNYWRGEGRHVLLAAGDTFRAAGVEQLEVWAARLGLQCIGSETGADPGSIVYDAIGAAKARGMDLILTDTAGRLHTKSNLMEELRKIRRIIDRHDVETRSILVLDATTGQNAIAQARSFADAAGLDGIMVAKLDGTARGGMVFSIVHELGAPVLFIGTGEHVEDIAPFDAEAFVRALFETDQRGASGED